MEKIIFRSLENRSMKGFTTFGAPWKKGKVFQEDKYKLFDNDGNVIPIQSRVTAYWPDKSIKWSAHTGNANGNGPYTLKVNNEEERKIKLDGIEIQRIEDNIVVDTKKIKVSFSTSGDRIINGIWLGDKRICNYGKLVYIKEERTEEKDENSIDSIFSSCKKEEQVLYGAIEEVVIEEEGQEYCVIRVKGIHKSKDGEGIPYTLRFGVGYMEKEIKITHTFLVDHDGTTEYMKGLGFMFDCSFKGESYNRHIKMLGEEGIFHETSSLLLSWRPKISEELYKNQMSSQLLKDGVIEDNVKTALNDITVWNSYRIYQDSPRHYKISKGTGKIGCSMIDSLHGSKAAGMVGVSGEHTGIILGLRHFYEKYPSSLWVDNLSKDNTQITAWLWSYEHEAMDFRHYDTVGHASAYYEGFDEVRSTPYGIACTNELILIPTDTGVVEDTELEYANEVVNSPVMLVASPEYYHEVGAFGTWSLSRREKDKVNWFEEQMDRFLEFYKEEIKQREWYGLFHYGDVMHTYDATRHMWRYDMGGYAWQNTELVPTLWLWYSFLRTGREDIFTIAEAMTRHCSEIDIYHMGEYKGLGSRHNVLHWGCSCKEPRIAMAGHHRFYYYMTGDYRIKDIFEDVVDADKATENLDPLRFFYDKDAMVLETHARTGPDWSSYCSNWMTHWEQTGEDTYRDKMRSGIEDIKQSPYQLISGSDYEYSPSTGHLRYIGENAGGGSHLAICMGGPQIWFELSGMLEDKEFDKMLADYGIFYFLPKEEKEKKAPLVALKGYAFPYMASSIGAYGAKYYKDKALADLVIHTLYQDVYELTGEEGVHLENVENYINKKELKEIPWVSTNFVSQWCLNTIVVLELLKDYI